MRDYDSKKPLICIHIPKTAGTSLQYVLKQWFGKGFRRHYFDEKNEKMPDKVRLKKRFWFQRYIPNVCICGHFNQERGFGVLDYYPEVDQFITILRDPLEVHLSNYFFVKRRAAVGVSWRDGKELELKFEAVDDYLRNTRSFIPLFLPWDITLENFQEVLEKKFIHIGIASKLQRSVDILAEKLKKKKVSVPVKNVSLRDEEPSQSAMTDFKERHRLEYAIYEYVVELNR
jgi:hypothetical protein